MIDWEAFYNSFRQPDFIPGYEIQNRLGGGAFGEVYKARKRSIGKAYAIKFLKLDETQRELVDRELEHVRLFAAIDHPNLVAIEDMGVVHGVPFLVMSYAGEDTLARRLKRGDLDREAALRFYVQVCRGVLALHERRLAHFDLKPSNVFLKGDVARVGDYGLAKLISDGHATLSFGRGTPHYMAPEILRNRGDERADIYSLGVILYESMAGALPFDGRSQMGMPLREDDDPPRFPPDFPLRLRPVVERALRLDPLVRYQSCAEILAELGQTARPGDSIAFAPDFVPGRAVAASVGPAGGSQPPVIATYLAQRGSSGDDVRGTPSAAGAPLAAGAAQATRSAAAGRDAPFSAPAGSDRSEWVVVVSHTDLGRAAREMARGATSVARELWRGVRVRRKPRAPGAPGATGAATPGTPNPASPRARAGLAERSAAASGEVVSVRTLDDPDDEPDRGPTSAAPAGPQAGSGLRAAPAAPATIPVPPRSGGGVLGALGAAAVVAFESLVALVLVPLRGMWRLLVRLRFALAILLVLGLVAALIVLAVQSQRLAAA